MEKDTDNPSVTSKDPCILDATPERGTVKEIVERLLTEAGYGAHPAVHQLSSPYSDHAAFNAMRKDVRANGLKVKILKSRDGKIVDGRMRLAAMLAEKVEVTKSDFVTMPNDTDAAVKLRVTQQNLNRRQMSTGQIALMVAQMKLQDVPIFNEDYKALGTSEETVARATRVVKSGNQAVIEAVQSGALAVSHADRVVSGRVPVENLAPSAIACAAPQPVILLAETRSNGRPSGNVKVNALKRVMTHVLALEGNVDVIKKYWNATDEEVEQVKRCIALLRRVIAKPRSPSGPSANDNAGDGVAVH